MKIFHSGDWHIGSFKGPERDGVNLRSLDTKRCLEYMAERAEQERPELVLVPGDIFHTGKTWSDRCCDEVVTAIEIITRLAAVSGHVVVMKGTPNHDGEGQFKVLAAHFTGFHNVHIAVSPEVIRTEYADIAVLPGFDHGVYRAKFHGLGKEEENEVFSQELGRIVMGLRAQCRVDRPAVLMAHYTVPGCNTESGQSQILTQFEPMVPAESLKAAAYDLAALGHIHRPQLVSGYDHVYYSGSINANNFNDEGQERGFWIHYAEQGAFGREGMAFTDSEFVKTPYREFATFRFTDTDIAAIILGQMDEVAMNYWRWNGAADGKIVRVLYECSAENKKAFNENTVADALYKDGAFWVAGVTPERVEASADRTDLSRETDPEENLKAYLEEKGMDREDIERLILKARPIIAEAMAAETGAAFSGMFVPVEIEVKNYRTYAEERFSFEDIQFCTINGQNGAGKSSLFMDAIIDCIYEEPREGKSTSVKTPWLRNDEGVRSGYIAFTFAIGARVYRITRTRTKSGKGTLNLAELVAGEWEDRSQEKSNDTQADIERLIGVDSMTFKSCALIMQDQYGLFLQAPKEDRMVILGNLLGLRVYEVMNRIAGDKAREFGARTKELKQEMEIHNAAIKSYGDPEAEIERKKAGLQTKSNHAREVTVERDAKRVELLSLQETQERCNKLSEVISSLTAKKAATETNRGTQAEVIRNCKTVLDTEQTVMEKVGRYRKLEARKKELIEATALFGTKQAEAARADSRKSALGSELATAKLKLQTEQGRLAVYENTDGDDEILRKAEEYQIGKETLDGLQVTALKYQEAERTVQSARMAQASTEKAIEALDNMIGSTRSFLGKDIAILSDNCGCINIENANCKFLEKAKASKDELQREEEKYKAKRAVLDAGLAENKESVRRAVSERDAIGYDPEKKADAERHCAELLPFVAKAEQVKKKAGEIALIKASIENVQSNISDIEKRFTEAAAEAERAKTELEQYRGAFVENSDVAREMETLASWLEQEKQLPVIRERLSNATQRFSELDLQIAEQEKELAEKQAELSQEILKTTGLAEKQEEVNRLNAQIESLEGEIKVFQMDIGALTQKMEQIMKLKEEISVLQGKERDAARETADYDTLKATFGQDGIPHQIIRTIVPKLAAAANTILGQMTGGEMGIDFKTEKVMKSNSRKEVVTLDIFIEEHGKSSLPYLSKSGGEKVKASLSVILALAETKAATAGVQFGMLFIDEPPFLDADGIQAYCDALETIQERYGGSIKIMAITHDPTMKSRFPQSVDVVKTENGSRVIY